MIPRDYESLLHSQDVLVSLHMEQKYFHTWSVLIGPSTYLSLKLLSVPLFFFFLRKSSYMITLLSKIDMNLTLFPFLANVDREMYCPVGVFLFLT